MKHLDQIFLNNFIKKINEKQEKEKLLSLEAKSICEKKRKKLEPIMQFLDKFVEQGVKVSHKDKFNLDLALKDEQIVQPQRFNYYEADSSESWAPGVSILFDHPAEVEIAIHYDSKQKGIDLFVVKVASPHPHTNILQHNFSNPEDLCKALAEFLFLNTVELNPDYKKLLNEEEKGQNHFKQYGPEEEKSFLAKIPNQPPKKTAFGIEQHSVDTEENQKKS